MQAQDFFRFGMYSSAPNQNYLEPRQIKNNPIQSKIIPILKLPRLFPHYLGGEKVRQFQSWNLF